MSVKVFIRFSRKLEGRTQEKFAERSGFSQQYISGLECGRRNPTVVTLYELAQALGVGHLELLKPDRRGWHCLSHSADDNRPKPA